MYGLNTFYFPLDLDIARAQQRRHISNALITFRTTNTGCRVCYRSPSILLHPRLKSVKRLELELNVKIPARPPWREPLPLGITYTDNRFGDICRFLAERGRLDIPS